LWLFDEKSVRVGMVVWFSPLPREHLREGSILHTTILSSLKHFDFTGQDKGIIFMNGVHNILLRIWEDIGYLQSLLCSFRATSIKEVFLLFPLALQDRSKRYIDMRWS